MSATPTLTAAAVMVTVVAAIRGTWSPCGLSMVSAINPVAERARGHRYRVTTLWFIAGSALGGLVLGAGTGLLAWLVGPSPLPQWGAAVAVVAALGSLVAVASDLRVGGWQLPIHPRQVNERWLDGYRRWIYATGFGAQIGCGFATYVMTAATYLIVLLGALGGSPAVGVTLGVIFGVVRGAAVLLSARSTSTKALMDLHRALDRLAPWSRGLVIGTEVVTAAALAAVPAPVFGPVVTLLTVAALIAASPHRSWRRRRGAPAGADVV